VALRRRIQALTIPLEARVEFNPHGYALQKLADALETLATHPGDVRERLASAYLCFHPLQERDFPAELQADWNWVMNELTKFGPGPSYDGVVRAGSVEHTMSRIKKATGSKIAKKLFELYWSVSGHNRYM
jgi:hypothetical protein